jgi:hypothetical protein
VSRAWGEGNAALAAAVASVCLLAAPSAGAAASAPSAAGSYRAPAECPNEAAWRAALHAHVGAELAPLAAQLEIEIGRVGGDASPAYEGRAAWGGVGSSRDGRRVRGASCREVFEALTLIARLGLARLSSESSESSEPGAPVRDPPPTPPGWTLTAQDELELARDPAPEQPGTARASERLRLSGSALALWGGAARATASADLGLALTASWKSDRLQPFLLVGGYGGSERFGVSGTTAGARLERLSLHAVACPLRFPRETALGVRPCVDLDAGVLRGSGVSVDGAREHTAPWLSAGLQLRAEWSVWGPLELGAMVGGVVALSRPRFYFVPDTTAFQADAAAFRAGASLGVSF